MTLVSVPNPPPLKPTGRNPGESWEAYAARQAAWWATPEGQAEEAADRERKQHQKTAEETARRVAWADRIGIPERYRFLGEPTTEPIDTQAITAVKQPAELTVLSGAAGCGKTAAACWWLMNSEQGARGAGAPMFLTAARLSRISKFDDEVMGRILR